MFKLLVSLFFVMCTSTRVLAHKDHEHPGQPSAPPEQVCSERNSEVCVHLHFLSEISTSKEGQFIVHIETPNDQEVTDFKLDLWMNMGSHGHGSSPVDINLASFNKYKITNAWFVMGGVWLVRTQFVLNNELFKIEIPVQVAE